MQEKKNIEKDDFKPYRQDLDGYTKYTGIAFRMIAIIGVFTFGGYKLDEWLKLNYPIFTIIFIFSSVAIAIYAVIRSLK